MTLSLKDMNKNIAIEFENVGKQYRLGLVGTGSLQHDINRWWQTTVLRREDPYLKIGEVNDRSTKGHSDYVWALKDISFKVEQGDVVGIIGKNGAGKSTLLKLLSHITAPTTGDIWYRGRIASLLEVGTGFHPEMTARQNIYMNGSIMGMTKAEISRKLDEIVDFAGIERYLDTPVKRFSSGMTVRLGFAVAAFLEPEILVVDEVLAVGDAEFQKKAIGKMKDVSSAGGRTVLFVSHNMNAVKSLCNHGVILENGQVSFIGTAAEAVKNYIGKKQTSFKTNTITTKKNRPYDMSRNLEILSAKLKSSVEMAQDESIEVELDVKKNNPSTTQFTIEMMIDDIEEKRVGSFISPVTQVPNKEQFGVKITISHHNLARGTYILNFNIGMKAGEYGYQDFDIVYEMLSFEVKYINEQKKNCILTWRDGWGNIDLKYGIVEIV